ncbi:hypothetical protein DFH08DRAFT_803898 [Mycena albidolilacea]|uniref:Uncharacterized protein n=1 Tax=Mycena albidolilacea TaxID=1033008 RepID=A0AAD7AE61_9AGAR|nr:hypothetical protein DFH08DRAFT_803898 [Mycena albidolilacea]
MAKNKKRVDKGDTNSDNDAQPQQKKRGSSSDFAGQRLVFLTSKIPEYVGASKKKGTKLAKTEGLRVFWPKVFQAYWDKFPWDLPLTEEPDAATLPAPDANTAPPEENTVDEDTPESDHKSKVMKDQLIWSE